MRILLIGFIVAAALVGGGTATSAASSPLLGVWEAIDLDDSHMTLKVTSLGEQGSVRMHLVDRFAGGCVALGARGPAATARGSGTVEGNTLTFTWDEVRCTNGIVFPTGSEVIFVYDPATDTLLSDVDFGGITWHRVRARAL